MEPQRRYLDKYADIFTDSAALGFPGWVCPGNRQLILRSRLNIGWSSKSHKSMDLQEPCAITSEELEQIRLVLERAQARDDANEERLTKLVDRFQNMKRQTAGNGTTHCLHCGAELGGFVPWSSAAKCFNCKKSVCKETCGAEVPDRSGHKRFLCNICSEEREVLKKTKACFYTKAAYSAQTATNSPSPLSPCISQQHRRSYSGRSSPHHSPIGSRSSSPRRRLPEPPIGAGSSRPGTPTESASASESPSYTFRPQWLNEETTTGDMQHHTRDNGPNHEHGFKPEGPAAYNVPCRIDIADNSDADQPESPTVSRYESTNDSDSTISREPGQPAAGGNHIAPSDISDSYSIDSGVAASDRSSRYIYSEPSPALPSSETEVATESRNKQDQQSPNNKTPSSPDQSDAPLSSQFSGMVVSRSQGRQMQEQTTAQILVPEAKLPVGATVAPAATATTSGPLQEKQKPEASMKPIIPESLSLSPNQESGLDDQLSSSPDDDSSSLGTLEFSLLYDAKEQTLTVHIVKAQNLRSMDPNGFSDPYVKLHVLPGATKSTQLRTKTITKNLNPEWNETLVYYGLDEREVLKKTLRLSVLDEDTFGHDFLGETRVELKRLSSGRERKFNVYLEKQFPIGKSEAAPQSRGKIMISLLYVSSKSQLIVGIIRCAELIGMDPNGYSDPYVKVHLKPDKKLKFKTPIKKRTCNPEFNCEFNFPCPATDLPDRVLEITVLDKDIGKHDDYIGGIQLSGSVRGEALRHWTACLKNPNQRTERWHRLTDEQFE